MTDPVAQRLSDASWVKGIRARDALALLAVLRSYLTTLSDRVSCPCARSIFVPALVAHIFHQ